MILDHRARAALPARALARRHSSLFSSFRSRRSAVGEGTGGGQDADGDLMSAGAGPQPARDSGAGETRRGQAAADDARRRKRTQSLSRDTIRPEDPAAALVVLRAAW